ncbi:MAG: hypothetical protein HOF01_03315 [Chloroflexi bacterium]|nr:hypothetical protein [Chloroflexota bacterium]
MNCEKCGQNNAPDASFCTWCGTTLVPEIDQNAIPHRDLGQLISRTFDVYGKNFWAFIIIGLPPQLLGLITLFAFPDIPSGFPVDFGSETSQDTFDDIAAAGPVLMLIGFLTFFAVVIVQGATIHAVAKQYLNQDIDVSESLRRGLSKSLILIVASILALIPLVIAGGLAVFLIGIPLLIFLIISLTFTFPLIMIKGVGPVSALTGSFNFVKGSRMRVLGVGIVFLLLQFGLQVVASIVTGIITNISDPLATFVSSAATAVIAPIMFIGLTVFYFDIRSRKEGLTLDTLAAELGEGVPGGSRPNDLRDM